MWQNVFNSGATASHQINKQKPHVKCRALLGSGLRLKANRVRRFRGSGGNVRGERNLKMKSTYFRGSSPPIYTSSKLPSCNTDYKFKPSKNPPEYSFLSTESFDVFHNFPSNSINILPELSGVFHPLPYYILSSVPLHHTLPPFDSTSSDCFSTTKSLVSSLGSNVIRRGSPISFSSFVRR